MIVNNIPSHITKVMLFFGIAILVTSPAFALGAGARNMLLIGAMAISPLLLVQYPIFNKRVDLPLMLFLTCTISFPLIFHPLTMRWSTALYSGMFGVFFMAMTRLFHFSDAKLNDLQVLFKSIIYAYLFVLLIQQTCVLFGFPIFNVSNYSPLEPWKLNSLMSEPEHSGRMVALLMYSFLTMKEIEKGAALSFKESWNEDKILWCAFLWVMLTMVSAGAYLFLLVVLSKLLNRKTIVSLLALVLVLAFIVTMMGGETFMRTYKLVLSVFTFDTMKMFRADHSGALRFVPSIICWQHLDLTSLNGWFGYGVDYTSTFLYRYVPGVVKGYTGGGLMLYALEYGFLSFLIFAISSFRYCYDSDNKIATITFWTFSILLSGVNLQITWSTMMLLYINKKMKELYLN